MCVLVRNINICINIVVMYWFILIFRVHGCKTARDLQSIYYIAIVLLLANPKKCTSNLRILSQLIIHLHVGNIFFVGAIANEH